MDHDRNRRRFGKADDELVGWFACAIGVKAQNIDANGSDGNPEERHYSRLRAMNRGTMAWYDAVAATIGKLTPEHRQVIALVYTPHAAPTWLQDALSTPWGGGSLVQLAATLQRAQTAAHARVPGQTVVDWLTARGRRAKDPLLAALREDAEALRVAALTAYDPLRVDRVKREETAKREAARERERRNADLYAELTGRNRARDSARFERRLRAS